MRKLFLFLCLFLIPYNVFAGTCGYDSGTGWSNGTAPWYPKTGASPGSVDSLEFDDVKYCMESVLDNDETIYLPAGTESYTSQITVTKNGFSVIGAGTTSTIITITSTVGFYFTGEDFDISQLALVDGETSDCIAIKITGTGWRVHDNKITNNSGIAGANVKLVGTDTAYPIPAGVIDSNTLINGKILHGGDGRAASMNGLFAADLLLGTDNGDYTVYIEDNTITSPDGIAVANFVDSNYGSHYVVRYNNVDGRLQLAHGNQANPASVRPTKFVEVYGNTLSTTVSKWAPMNLLSGTGIFFKNEVSGNWNALTRGVVTQNDRSLGAYDNSDNTGLGGECDGDNLYDGNLSITSTMGYGDDGDGVITSVGNGSTTFTISGKSWTVDALIDIAVYDVTDGDSVCLITDNTSDTVVCDGLSGGDTDTFEVGDTIKISNGYPCRDQPGMGKDASTLTFGSPPYPTQAYAPFYSFLNTDADDDDAITSVYVYSGTSKWIQENINYFQDNDTFVPGTDTTLTTGLVVGTAAQMAIITTCTEGVAFWVTDENDWFSDSHTAATGATSSGSDGQLYTCDDSNTFNLYFVPEPFPHPLRGTDETAPNIEEVTPVPTPSTDTTPTVVISTDEAGTLSCGGDCSCSGSVTVGNNNVDLGEPGVGVHSNCTVTVTDASENASGPLSLTTFEILSSALLGSQANGQFSIH